jgi:glutathionyl-hydroquinone reductase
MGLLVNGEWDSSNDTARLASKFVRPPTSFRDKISKEPEAKFPAVAGRYHLYVSLACPWAHRTLIVRKLKNLEDAISVSVVSPLMNENGWEFSEYPGSTPDPLYNSNFMYQIYVKADPTYSGRVSVPVLWDKETHTIVSNESSEIIVMLNEAFEGNDFYPEALRPEIDQINDLIYNTVNNGVYKSGFTREQEDYEKAVTELFNTLDLLEKRLSEQRYLVGNQFTLADVRLFTTLVRFDPVYVGHFKCNIRRLVDYPNLWNYTKDIYQTPGITETVNLDHIKKHYYMSHPFVNPTRIVPKGPEIDFNGPHDRNRFN